MTKKFVVPIAICLVFSVSLGVMLAFQTGITASAAGKSPLDATAHIINPFLSPDWIGESDLDSTFYGSSVASAGDVNGDGYDDVIIGAPYFSNGQNMEGRAYVYYGSPTGLPPLPAWTFESNLVECELGWSVASAGDVNGDGYDDVLVASEFCGDVDREGRVYLFFGSASGLASTHAWMLEGAGADESLGWSIASAGDVNGDAYDDVIIGAPWASYPQGHEGRAYVFYGSASGLALTADWSTESNAYWSDLGVSVASAGDVNGDGYSDVIIGHSGLSNPEDREGRAYVYLGSASGLAPAPVWMYEIDLAGGELGESVASAGDVNGDGFSDVLVGGFKYSNPDVKEGIACLFLGTATGVEWTPAWYVESNLAYSEYGQSVAAAGDVNLDGYDDVLVGAPWYSNGEDYEGRAFLYFGSAAGLLPDPIYTTEPDQADAHMGYSVAHAGDINGDGIADMIVGVSAYDGGQGNEGRAIVYYGQADAEYLLFAPAIWR